MQMLAQSSSAAVASSKLGMPLPLCPRGILHKTQNDISPGKRFVVSAEISTHHPAVNE